MDRTISIRGARTHNLANISLEIPRGMLTVVTGVSGSGKSSLVFDTLYAEGQRRFVQSMSTYARMFLERMERPDVDSISQIPPALALRQKNTIKNARSTVGTVTEISDYLRLLFATVGITTCPQCGGAVRRDTVESAGAQILATPGMYLVLAPFEAGSRSMLDAANYLIQNGYHRLFIGGAITETVEFASRADAADARPDSAMLVIVDRISVNSPSDHERVREALEKAFYLGGSRARAVRVERSNGNGNTHTVATLDFDRRFNCSNCATPFAEPTSALFSSNSPIGACAECEGFGRTVELDLEKVIPNPNLSLRQGLIAPWRTPAYHEMNAWMLKLARRRKIRTTAPFREMTDEERGWLLDGDEGPRTKWDPDKWPGVHGFFKWLEGRRYKTHVRILLAKYRRFVTCPSCAGSKLKRDALNVRVDGASIADVGRLSVRDLIGWLDQIARRPEVSTRAGVVMRELRNRVSYLLEVGLGYLTIERQARTLSGGEAQRIHLATALGSVLVGTLYALDEPTVGLHAADARRLLGVLHHLRDFGNTVVVVEHDPGIIAGADNVVELGPGGGTEGGRLIYSGDPALTALDSMASSPGRVLLMRALSKQRKFAKHDPSIRITGAREHNLAGIDVALPLGRMICITGVSGSGKSSLVEDVLYNNYLRSKGISAEVGECDRIDGLDQIGAIVHMGQELPTRSMRSNPATYLKIYDEIRKLFASSPEAKRLKVQPRHFSFNVTGGRCEKCRGTGTVTIEMHFMADLEVKCDSCDGRRFQSHILAIRYRKLNINQVLDLTVEDARRFFAHSRAIVERLDALNAVGLGYLRLGQTTSTLSGGEAQRLKLARFLLVDLEPTPVNDAGKSLPRMFLLDEPTTGLSSTDIRRLTRVLSRLVAEGNTLVVIEHNLEFIAHADYVIDLGPGGGDEGGRIVACGSPVDIAASEKSETGRELRRLFGLPERGRQVRSAIRTAAGA
ncbi:MAG: excinuclease ABC subunit UvrA [Candidatus Binatus sp.]|uniref:excinuclease ABC subunit UvrA n=1 Tax=Candidatus Binatus sp. TaxID=2811406 RepID=UPI00271584BE|nr:excinuclease ABC subunit UvrA [Candidatus Binatus sp.]MDO8433779.1 excinuclease ABC subunit UvrA [Candidatus Binatus sp.]